MWWRRDQGSIPSHTLALIFILTASHAAASAPDDMIVTEIELNGETRGDFVLLREGETGYWLKEEDWRRLRLLLPEETPQRQVDGERYRLIDCASAAFRCTLNVGAARLTLVADGHRLMTNEIVLERRARPDLIESSSGFLNYTLGYDGSEGSTHSFTLPFEAGWRAGEWLAIGDFTYRHGLDGHRFTRMFTSIERQDVERRSRLVIGDFSASSGSVLGGGGTFGGLSYSSDFALDPFFVRLPGLELSGVLEYPSEVEVLVDGQIVAREDLPAGPFDLSNISRHNGLTDTTLVIRDPFGNQRRVETSVYVPRTILREGVQEFGYAFGFRREHLGRENFDYGGWAALGFHRMGLAPWLTLGAHAELDQDIANAGIEGGFLLDRLGELSFDFAASRHKGEWAAAAALAYQYTADRFYTSLVAEGFTEGYATLNAVSSRRSRHYDGRATIGYDFPDWGGLTLSHRESGTFNDHRERSTSLQYRVLLMRGLTFLTSCLYDWQADEYRAFAGLNYYFGEGLSANLRYGDDDGRSTAAVSVQKSPDLYRGIGFRLGAGYREGSNSPYSYDGEVSYYGAVGDYRGAIFEAAGRRRYRARASGGLAFIDGGVYLSPPIRTGYALVDAGVPDVEVKLNNNRAARTGKSGKAVIAGLSAYNDNRISVETAKLPVYYSVPKSQKRVSTHARGGIIIELPVLTARPAYGKLVVAGGGQTEAAEYWRLQVAEERETHKYLIGKRGEFYIEGLPPGTYPAEATFEERTCRFELHIPDGNDLTFNLGEVVCELE